MATFGQVSRSVWDNVARVSGGAAVFLDGKAAELLHWAGGVRTLGECVGAFDLYSELSAVAVDSIAAVRTTLVPYMGSHQRGSLPRTGAVLPRGDGGDLLPSWRLQ